MRPLPVLWVPAHQAGAALQRTHPQWSWMNMTWNRRATMRHEMDWNDSKILKVVKWWKDVIDVILCDFLWFVPTKILHDSAVRSARAAVLVVTKRHLLGDTTTILCTQWITAEHHLWCHVAALLPSIGCFPVFSMFSWMLLDIWELDWKLHLLYMPSQQSIHDCLAEEYRNPWWKFVTFVKYLDQFSRSALS